MIELGSSQRRALRARAHSLNPVASISQNGLTDAVLAEIDRGLKAHELIKVRIYGAERSERETLLGELCTRLQASPVQHIGNILVVFRQNPEKAKPASPPPPKRRKAVKAASPRQRLRN
jgi:putative YhbY family RNA-binding protein